MILRWSPLLFVVFFGGPVYALSPFFSLGFGSGGTRLSTVTGGQDFNTQAGQGFFLSTGLVFPVSDTVPHRFEGQVGVGYLAQFDSRVKENEVSWTRVPLEALYFYRNTESRYRLGWGATYHTASRLKGKGVNSSVTTAVDDSWGWVLAAEKYFQKKDETTFWSAGIRYVVIDYHAPTFSKEVDGSAFSVTLSAFL